MRVATLANVAACRVPWDTCWEASSPGTWPPVGSNSGTRLRVFGGCQRRGRPSPCSGSWAPWRISISCSGFIVARRTASEPPRWCSSWRSGGDVDARLRSGSLSAQLWPMDRTSCWTGSATTRASRSASWPCGRSRMPSTSQTSTGSQRSGATLDQDSGHTMPGRPSGNLPCSAHLPPPHGGGRWAEHGKFTEVRRKYDGSTKEVPRKGHHGRMTERHE